MTSNKGIKNKRILPLTILEQIIKGENDTFDWRTIMDISKIQNEESSTQVKEAD